MEVYFYKMKVSDKYYDEVFDFAGQWELPSKCGLKIIEKEDKKIVIVTELYQDNPGTSVTGAGYLLAKQIGERKGIQLDEMIYLECNPDTNSKLSFYNEAYFEVTFPEVKGETGHPEYHKVTEERVFELLTSGSTNITK
jgi:hypothetical protein